VSGKESSTRPPSGAPGNRASPATPNRVKGRGASSNPPNRFERIDFEWDPDIDPAFEPLPTTEFLRDTSRTAIAYNVSPDIPFDASVNPYRGCEHGCIYCYARPFHEYLGFSAGLDFETKIVVKEDAPELLSSELASSRWKPRVLAISGVTDPYQPVERRLKLTRRCIEVIAEFRNPIAVVTKNHLVTRDIDLLAGLAEHGACVVYVSVTTLDGELARKMEPRTSQPERRLKAIEALSGAGVPTGVLMAPVIPGLNDYEIPSVVEESARAGAGFAGYVPLRLPQGVKGLFAEWLEAHYPARKSKVLNKVRSMRGGRLDDSGFGSRMRGEGVIGDQMASLFELACRRAGIDRGAPALSTEAFRVPKGARERLQLELFD